MPWESRLVEALARQSQLRVIAVDPDAELVEAVRIRLDAAGLYGSRVAVHAGDPSSFPFPPYVASLIVTEDLDATGLSAGAESVAKMFHPLRPYGGVACLPTPEDKQDSFAAWWTKDAGLASSQLTPVGGYTLLRRTGAIPGSDDWSHESGDAGGTFASRDTLVKLPLGVLWFGGPAGGEIYFDRHGSPSSALVVAGRMFIQGPSMLHAVDAYTGRILWKASLPNSQKGHRCAATEDRVYLWLDSRILVFDAVTGEQKPELKFAGNVAEVKAYKDALIVAAGGELAVVDRHSVAVRWEREGARAVVAVGDDKVFFVEGLSAGQLAAMKRRGETLEAKSTFKALDLRNGELLWSKTAEVYGNWLAYSDRHDVLLGGQRAEKGQLKGMTAFQGNDGQIMWEKPIIGGLPFLLRDDMVITQGAAYSLLTGERKTRVDPLTGAKIPWSFSRAYGCNYAIAGENLITFRSGCAGYYDLLHDGGTGNWGGVRSGCRNTLIPANGLLNAPKFAHGCVCTGLLQSQFSPSLATTWS